MDTEQQPTKTDNKDNQTNQNKPSLLTKLKFLITGLSILALIIGFGYLYFCIQKKNTHLNELTSIKQQVKNNQESLAIWENATEQKFHELNNQYLQLSQENETLKRRLDNLINVQNQASPVNIQQKTFWKLSEIEYLIKIAQLKISEERDSQSAISLIKQAQQLAKSLTQSRYTPIIQSISITLDHLEQLNIIDPKLLLTKLRQLNEDLLMLPFKQSTADQETIADEIEPQLVTEASLPKWRTAFNQALAQFKSLIVIEKLDAPTPIIISTEAARNAIEQNINLRILELRLAVLRYDQPQYIHLLTELSDLIRLYYLRDDAVTQSALAEIVALQQINIAPKLPDLDGLIKLINEVNHSADTPSPETIPAQG